MDSKKANNKIMDIVRLQQMLKKWKKLAVTPKGNSKSIKFLKRTLSLSNTSSALYGSVPKGFLALCVGEEMKRFVIPMEYLSHRAFGILLQEAEEEFGFEQEGVLRIPCDVSVFENILEMVEKERKDSAVAPWRLSLLSPITIRNQCADNHGCPPFFSSSFCESGSDWLRCNNVESF